MTPKQSGSHSCKPSCFSPFEPIRPESEVLDENHSPGSHLPTGDQAVENELSPSVANSHVDKLIADLREQNEGLKKELEGSQQREYQVGKALERLEDKFHKEMMKLESISMQREVDTREAYQQEIVRLRKELDGLRGVQEECARLEGTSAYKEIKLLEEANKKLSEKLTETQEKLGVSNERIERLADAKAALAQSLAQEEEARAASVQECFRLEKEIESLNRQNGYYKTRALESEMKLEESQEEFKRVSEIAQDLNNEKEELLLSVSIHKEDADSLRHQLLEIETKSSEFLSLDKEEEHR